jgi:hypothetical protein
MHLPRAALSDRHLDLHLWLLRANGVHGVPGVKAQKGYVRDLQKLYGIKSTCYEGSLGHRYYLNSIANIISQVGFCEIFSPPTD